MVRTERELIGLALALGAAEHPNWSEAEKALARQASSPPDTATRWCRDLIRAGNDPLGDALCALRSPAIRRPMGATYTPRTIVASMVEWAASQQPQRIVDPGAGSGRFLIAAGARFKKANLIAAEIDPLAGLLLRANAVASGVGARVTVVMGDYCDLHLPTIAGTTLFLGNPPYVRHHLIGAQRKAWLVETARHFKLDASQLAGLHVHFFLASAVLARAGDCGALITAAEWLDVNYGSLVRGLFLGVLGGKSIHLIEPTAHPFADADTTAAITCFEVGAKPKSIRLRRVEALGDLGALDSGRLVRRERLESSQRWTPLTRPAKKGPDGYVELGELCHVHRGQVTGSNKVWIAGSHSACLPGSVLFPSVTKARELFSAGVSLADPATLRRVIDIPAELDALTAPDKTAVERFLKIARAMGADKSFTAQHRKAWWAVGLRKPAPILATYMARRPPAFVRNLAEARHINIAHGLYPRDQLSPKVLDGLARFLSGGISLAQGRTYAGGLTKFEPKEMERILVPSPMLLAANDA